MRLLLIAIAALAAAACGKRDRSPEPGPLRDAPVASAESPPSDPAGAAAVAEVRRWLSKPSEFGRPPASATLVWSATRKWPFVDEPIAVQLVAYEYDDGERGVAVTGPITWSFLEVDFSTLSHEELVRLYAGWYINFAMINDPNGQASQSKALPAADIEAALTRQGYTVIQVLDRLHIGDDTYFAARATRDGAPRIVAGTVDDTTTYDPAAPAMQLPPLYWYLGDTFFSE